MKTLSIKLPDPLDRKLEAMARKKRKKKETLVKQALEAYLAEASLVQAKPGSFLDVAKDYLGCIKGGPADLSTNPAYMEGYGRERRRAR